MNAESHRPPNPRHDLDSPRLPVADIHAIHNEVMALIRRSWPELAAEIEEDVRIVCPFSSRALYGWADIYLLGAVFVREDTTDVSFVLERLVHQAAHVRLFLISHGPLHNHSHSHLVTSPIREDPRPVNGVFHAAFVYSRLISLFTRIGEPAYMQRRSELLPRFAAAIDTLTNTCRLTPRGKSLVQSMSRLVETVIGPN
jgi:HEXXH motif-containing protein